jgi:hypothetical protein
MNKREDEINFNLKKNGKEKYYKTWSSMHPYFF